MELISKEDVLKCFRTTLLLPSGVDVQPIMLWYDQTLGNIKALPIIESRPKGEWIDNSEDGYVECPFCHEATTCDDNIDELRYCWNCGSELGADMRGEE